MILHTNDWELPNIASKNGGPVGLTNRKRTLPASSSSPPLTQWAYRRPQNISRTTRRTNIVLVVPNNDDIPYLDSGTKNGLGFVKRVSTATETVLDTCFSCSVRNKPARPHTRRRSDRKTNLRQESTIVVLMFAGPAGSIQSVMPTTKHNVDSFGDILLCQRLLLDLIPKEGKDNENNDTDSNGCGSTFEDETDIESNGFIKFSGVHNEPVCSVSDYQTMSMDNRIRMEIQSIRLWPGLMVGAPLSNTLESKPKGVSDRAISDDVDDGLFIETHFTKPEPFLVPESKDELSSLLGTTETLLVLLRVCDMFWGLRSAHCVTGGDEVLVGSLLELMLLKRPKENTKCVSAAGEELTAARHKLKLLILTCNRLQNSGYNSAICKSKWKSSLDIPAGEHTFVDVIDDSNSKKGEVRVVIELELRGQFAMKKGSEEYNSLVCKLPEVFVGKFDRLQTVVKILSHAAKKCMKEKKMHLGPWRKERYMQAKWLRVAERTTTTTLIEPLAVVDDYSTRPARARSSMLTMDLLDNLPNMSYFCAHTVKVL
nr:hypothetical protein [Tanacetum cinerariifolium]